MNATIWPLLIYYYCSVVMSKTKMSANVLRISVELVRNINRCELQSQSKPVSQKNERGRARERERAGGEENMIQIMCVCVCESIRYDSLIFLRHSVFHFYNWIIICHFLRLVALYIAVLLAISKQAQTQTHHMHTDNVLRNCYHLMPVAIKILRT